MSKIQSIEKAESEIILHRASKKPDYNSWPKEQLIAEVERLRKRKRYGLVWEEKPEDVVERCKTEFPVLKEVKDMAIAKDADASTNILIEGDNYHALSVLNYTHKGNVDVIYIDPPYNTGARDWKYNNNFVDAEDPYRHTKWLSFMARRLELSKNLLTHNGIICITIDDNELPRLWLLMEKFFYEYNHLGTVVIRNNPKGRMTNRKISLTHEYALFFGKTSVSSIYKLPVAPEDKTHNYQQDSDGTWFLAVNLRKQGVDSTAHNRKGELSDRFYPIYFDPKAKRVSSKKKYKVEILPIDQRGEKRIWRRSKDAVDEMYKKGDLWVKDVRGSHQVYYKFRGGLEGQMPKSIWYDSKFSASEYGTQILDSIVGARETFQYPKSPYAVADCILAGTNKNDAVILDFFAGSGTTGQAVLQLNNGDGGNRQFILCTDNENNIATDVCYPRVAKVIKGYKNSKGETVAGLGGNLRYFRTAFVGAELNDKNKEALTRQATEMLCMRENTFEPVEETNAMKIFKNSKQYTGIIFDEDAISILKKHVAKLGNLWSIYIFSLGDDTFEDEFEDMEQKITVAPIPEAILRVYRRLFKP